MTVKSSLLFTCILLFATSAKPQDLQGLGIQKPITINGTLGIGMGTYNVNGIPARQKDFNYTFSGSPTITIYGISLPFSVVVSDQQRSYVQPFNQYGLSPNYKWATLHVGWRNINFSPFSLAGHTFLGTGLELNPGKIRFGFIYGRFNKAVEEDLNQPITLAQEPAYKRTGYSAKIGYGTQTNYIDFIFLKAKDDSASLIQKPVNTILSPSQNSVSAISSRVNFLKHFAFSADVSGSVFTKDIGNDVAYLDSGKYDFLSKLVKANGSTRISTAAQASIGYNTKNYVVKANYKRIDPDYKSMGAYYFETDVVNYTFEGLIRLLKSSLQVSGSFGLQHDNILKDKEVQSKRKVGSANISYNKASFGADLRYSNYGISQQSGLNPVLDLYRVARTNHNLSSLFRYNINGSELLHNFVLLGNMQSVVDLNDNTKANSESSNKNANISYQLNLIKKQLSFSASFNYTKAHIAINDVVFYGPTISFNKSFIKGTLNLNTSINYQEQINNGVNNGRLLNGLVNTAYRVGKRNALNLSLIYLNSQSDDLTIPTFNEFRTNFGLTHSF